jgi:hypothetical protein
MGGTKQSAFKYAKTTMDEYAKTTMDAFVINTNKELAKTLERMQTQHQQEMKAQSEAQIRALAAHQKTTTDSKQAQSNPKVLTKTLVESMVETNKLRAAADEKKELASIEATRQHTMALAKGSVEQATRNQLLVAMSMGGGRHTQQQWQGMGGATANETIGAMPMLGIAQQQEASTGHAPVLAITQQESSKSNDELETDKLRVRLENVKKRLKEKAIQEMLLKEIEAQEALLDGHA